MREVPSQESGDINNPEVQRELLFAQDPRLLEAVSQLAMRLHAMPRDPKFPDIEPEALIVGGFVRDSLLGLRPKDADVEVYGVSPERLQSMLEQMFPGRVILAGKAFGTLKVKVDEGIEFDVTPPRRESKSGKGHTGFTIESDPAMGIEDAMRRRDFTFNVLAADILTGEVHDYFGGLKDLSDRILRVTDRERFQDDPLRVWRAVQFTARMNLTVEENTKALLQEMVERGDLDELSKERITEEFSKLMLKGERPSIGLALARELGIVEKYLPELNALIGVEQEPEWHPEGDVWTHTLMATDVAAGIIRQPERNFTEEEKLQVMLGTLCHDLGKPATTEFKDGRIRSNDHEAQGVQPTKDFFSHFLYAQDIQRAVEKVVNYHLQPNMLYRALSEDKMTLKSYINAVRKLLRKIAPASPHVLVACSESDGRGRTFPDSMTKPYNSGQKLIEVVGENNLEEEAKKDFIQGRDIIAVAVELGTEIKPGPQFKTYIRQINELRDAGEIETPEQAKELLRQWLSSGQAS